jgi:hypothetical protein
MAVLFLCMNRSRLNRTMTAPASAPSLPLLLAELVELGLRPGVSMSGSGWYASKSKPCKRPKRISDGQVRRRSSDVGITAPQVFNMHLSGSLRSLWPESFGAVEDDTEVIMVHGWKHWLGVFAAATVLASGLASIFHRDNTTAPQRQLLGRCSDACPCGTL